MHSEVTRTVLVVDDETSLLLVLKKRLSAAGCHVLTATDGTLALQLARDHSIDAMTLDVAMPGEMDGLEVATALRKDPKTAMIPVVFITGTADRDFKERCKAAGARYFLSKPYDSDLLIRVIDSILAKD